MGRSGFRDLVSNTLVVVLGLGEALQAFVRLGKDRGLAGGLGETGGGAEPAAGVREVPFHLGAAAGAEVEIGRFGAQAGALRSLAGERQHRAMPR
jgi:hypothetical protein